MTIINGQVVQMKTAASPYNITVARDSKQNGIVTGYNFTVIPLNYMLDGDQITITLPEPIRATSLTYCNGISENL